MLTIPRESTQCELFFYVSILTKEGHIIKRGGITVRQVIKKKLVQNPVSLFRLAPSLTLVHSCPTVLAVPETDHHDNKFSFFGISVSNSKATFLCLTCNLPYLNPHDSPMQSNLCTASATGIPFLK